MRWRLYRQLEMSVQFLKGLLIGCNASDDPLEKIVVEIFARICIWMFRHCRLPIARLTYGNTDTASRSSETHAPTSSFPAALKAICNYFSTLSPQMRHFK
jgi:hypothetical protein